DPLLTTGSSVLQATLFSGGNQTITVTDLANNTITGTSNTINVTTPTHFGVSAPSNVNTQSAFDLVVTALGADNGVIAAYSGTVPFTSSDAQADLPSAQAMTSGTQTFVAALKTPGSRTITVKDSSSGITGTATITVNAATAANPAPWINLPL